jgi:hypothetical protein
MRAGAAPSGKRRPPFTRADPCAAIEAQRFAHSQAATAAAATPSLPSPTAEASDTMEATAPLADDPPPVLEAPVAAAAGECPITDELLRRLREAGL